MPSKDSKHKGMKLNIWPEEGGLYIHAPIRSGIFYIELPDGHVIDFLADIERTGKKKKTTVYKYVGMRLNPEKVHPND